MVRSRFPSGLGTRASSATSGAHALARRVRARAALGWLALPRLLATAGLATAGLATAGLATGGLATAGCSSTGLQGNVYRGDGYVLYIAEPPASWKPIRVTGTALAWRDDAAQATIAVGARCDQDGGDVPLRALTGHLFLHFTEREILSEETLPFDGREALRTELTAKLDGVPKRFVAWVLKKDGCVYDLLFVGDHAREGAGVENFDAFAKSLRVDPRKGGGR